MHMCIVLMVATVYSSQSSSEINISLTVYKALNHMLSAFKFREVRMTQEYLWANVESSLRHSINMTITRKVLVDTFLPWFVALYRLH